MTSFTIYVDADSCPAPAKSIILKAALKHEIPVIYAANREIPFSIQSPLFKMIICPKEEGSADDYIAEEATGNDIVITRDIPLAKRLVDKKVCVINDRGTEFTEKNINQRLRERELNLMLNMAGVKSSRWSSYGNKETALFAECFDRVLNAKLKSSAIS